MLRFLIPLAALFTSGIWAFSCKDQNNNNVDWFIAYKMPKLTDNSIPGVGAGYGFYYLDAHNKALTPSANALNSPNQAIAYTLQQYYAVQSDANVFHAMYNDEEVEDSPDFDPKKAVQFGHTKGVTFFNKTNGIWLVHSVPKFPDATHYVYPESGTNYGQSMLCMTLSYAQLKNVGTQLFYNHAKLYSSSLPTSMASDNADLAQFIAGHYKSGTPTTSTIDLVTVGGVHFRSFAKSADFNQDLYQSLVAPSLQAPLNVETWRRGSPVTLDCSSQFRVLDAQTMKIGSSMTYSYTKDHSKLAVSAVSTMPYVCIGDINRMTSQYVRGGGTVCISDNFVWRAYNALIQTLNQC